MLARATAAGGVLGLVTLVLGTFLPWLRSGRVVRNSYQADGTIQRLVDAGRLLQIALSVWPFVGLLCGAAVALFALRLRRLAAALAASLGVIVGAVSGATLRAPGASYAAPASAGPIVTLLGAALTVLMATLMLVPRRTATREGEGHD